MSKTYRRDQPYKPKGKDFKKFKKSNKFKKWNIKPHPIKPNEIENEVVVDEPVV